MTRVLIFVLDLTLFYKKKNGTIELPLNKSELCVTRWASHPSILKWIYCSTVSGEVGHLLFLRYDDIIGLLEQNGQLLHKSAILFWWFHYILWNHQKFRNVGDRSKYMAKFLGEIKEKGCNVQIQYILWFYLECFHRKPKFWVFDFDTSLIK